MDFFYYWPSKNYLHSDAPELCIEKLSKNNCCLPSKFDNLKVEVLFVLQKFYNTYKTLVSIYFAKIK
jgi:hypothetical protein